MYRNERLFSRRYKCELIQVQRYEHSRTPGAGLFKALNQVDIFKGQICERESIGLCSKR